MESRPKDRTGRPRPQYTGPLTARIEAIMDTDLNTKLLNYAVVEFEKDFRRELDGSFENCQTIKDMGIE